MLKQQQAIYTGTPSEVAVKSKKKRTKPAKVDPNAPPQVSVRQ